jgi:hypothetical protein
MRVACGGRARCFVLGVTRLRFVLFTSVLTLAACGSSNSPVFTETGGTGGTGADGLGGSAAEGVGGTATGGSGGTGTGGVSTGGSGAVPSATGGAATAGNGGDGGSAGSAGSAGSDPGTGGSGAGAPDGGATTCADISCTAPAACEDASGVARCVCPAGYSDPEGDGSTCADIDECAEGTDDCDANAVCTNTPGGFECTCAAPAFTGDGRTCTCATGYTSVGEGCLKENIQICGAGTECASGHCVGGICCAVACDAPGGCEQVAGTVCVNGDTCQYGKQPDDTVCDDGDPCTTATCFEGVCESEGQIDCDDQNQCTVDTCDSTTGACVHETRTCDDNNPCTSDTCDPALGCRHQPDDAAPCTDGNPCTTDSCIGGLCDSVPLDCSGLTTDCTTGVCVGGLCQAQPANEGGPCDDGLESCDLGGACSGGACIGQDDACGPLAASCSTCTSEDGCFAGRLCTCDVSSPPDPPIVLLDGVCVFDADECNADPCDPIAIDCVDPTPDGSVEGDVQCVCPEGYTGDGRLAGDGCVDIDECAGQNPCGAGVAPGGCNGLSPPGSYSCTCDTGFTAVSTPTGPTCACDLSGTYALVMTASIVYPAVVILFSEVVEASGSDGVEITSWSLRHHSLEDDGTMTVRTIPCGGTSPTVCSNYFSTGLAQFQGNDIWGRASIQQGFPDISVPLAGVVPGGAYVEPETAVLAGITLDDPAGAWPPCRACVGVNAGQSCSCSGTNHVVTNRAQWFDSDGDGNLGISTWAVRRGGEYFGGTGYPDPPFEYPPPSECPRFSSGGPYDYGAWPGQVGLFGLFYTLEWRGASRVISALQGNDVTLVGNACAISGNVVGPDNGRARTDARVGGCRTCPSIGCTSATDICTTDQSDFYDNAEQTQQVASATFTLEKIPAVDLTSVLAMADGPAKAAALNQACQEARATYCPAGKNCTP